MLASIVLGIYGILMGVYFIFRAQKNAEGMLNFHKKFGAINSQLSDVDNLKCLSVIFGILAIVVSVAIMLSEVGKHI